MTDDRKRIAAEKLTDAADKIGDALGHLARIADGFADLFDSIDSEIHAAHRLNLRRMQSDLKEQAHQLTRFD